MRFLIILISVFSTLNSFSQLKVVPSPFPNPGNISGYIHISKQIDSTKKVPLVVVLHGCTQDAQEIAHDTEWNRLADSLGFHVLYPEQNKRNNISNCFNWFQANDNEKNKGELYSIERMISETIKTYSIDSQKVFVYGVSAGAAMSVALLINYPQKFKAGAILAGVPYGEIKSATDVAKNNLRPIDLSMEEWVKLARNCNPAYTGTYPKVIIMHGTKDYVVPIAAGYELCEQFIGLHECSINSINRVQNYQSVEGLNRNSISKNTEEIVIFYELIDWGHSIMVKPGNGPNEGGNTNTFAKAGGIWSTLQIVKDWGI